jgi:hypothetical protein
VVTYCRNMGRHLFYAPHISVMMSSGRLALKTQPTASERMNFRLIFIVGCTEFTPLQSYISEHLQPLQTLELSTIFLF